MDFKKLGLLVLCALALLVGALVLIRDHVIEKTEFIPDITDLSASYEAHEEIAAAAEKRAEEGLQPAEVITTLLDGTPRVALVFDGLPERPLAARLLDVLKKHGAEAVFFVEGENVADQPETVQLIRAAGQEIGNYTYVGLAALERADTERQLAELCRTQKAVIMQDIYAPTLFRAPRTVFTDDLLKSVRAAGIAYAVKENVRFSPGTLHTPAEAAAYAASIPNGSIIAIPVGRPVERKAEDPAVREERPAVDMKPTVQDDRSAALPPRDDLADELDRLLAALAAEGRQAVFVNQFRKIRYIPAAAPMPETASQAAQSVAAMQGGKP